MFGSVIHLTPATDLKTFAVEDYEAIEVLMGIGKKARVTGESTGPASLMLSVSVNSDERFLEPFSCCVYNQYHTGV